MSDIIFKYDPKKNPQGHLIDGVPLRDLTADDLERIGEQRAKAVAGAPFYVKVTTKNKKEGD